MRSRCDQARGGACPRVEPGKPMRSSVFLLSAILGFGVHAAERIPLDVFLNDIRAQLYRVAEQGDQEPVRAVISSVHVEMNVVVEKDRQGRPRYFVLDGVLENKDVVTQRISFDMELLPNASARSGHSGSRVYSTRRSDRPLGPGRYLPPVQHPPPGQYRPGIYPVIVFDNQW